MFSGGEGAHCEKWQRDTGGEKISDLYKQRSLFIFIIITAEWLK